METEPKTNGNKTALGPKALTVRPANTMVATTAAAPAISEVMWCICAAGLIEMPPVSKVMPLPISATFFGLLPFPPR